MVKGVSTVWDQGEAIKWDVEKIARGPRPGDATTNGTAALLRHEYGHHVFGQLTAEQRHEWIDILPGQRRTRDALTQYSGIGANWFEEAFSEGLAVVTDPKFKATHFPTDIQPAFKWIRGLTKPTP